MENEKIKIQEIQEKALSLPDEAKGIQVIDEESLHVANVFVETCRAMRRKICDLMDPIIKRDHEMHMADLADKRKLEDPIIKAENFVKPQIISYRRQIEELKRAAEEAARKALEEKKRKEEELLKQAAEAEEKGKVEEADDLFEQAEAESESAPAAVQDLANIPKVQKIRGVSTRKIWKWRLKNLKLVPRDCLILDEKKLNYIARTQEEKANVPGIEFYWI